MKNKYNLLKIFIIGSLFALPILLASDAQATPSAIATYLETELDGGLWNYDFIVMNTSDSIVDAGCDIYDFSLFFNDVNLTDVVSPVDWDLFTDLSSFIVWYSLLPGIPPDGSDISPGAMLSGFQFTSDARLPDIAFDVTFVNPNDFENPFVYSGIASSTAAPVPEPGTMLLLGTGLIAVIISARRARNL
jgi:hypothetical protein